MTTRNTIHFVAISLIASLAVLAGLFFTAQKVEAQSGTLSCSVTFDANPITSGQSTVVHWTSTGAPDSFFINGIGAVGGSGSATVSPASTRNFDGTVTIDPKTTTTGGSGTSGSQSFTSPGTYSFTVPSYGTLTAQVWGAGAGGGGGGGTPVGGPGGSSSFPGVSASGGAGGQNALHPAGGGSAAGGAGGSGSGGSINQTGGGGQAGALNAPGTGRGGAGASGGAGGTPAPCFSGRIAPGGPGSFPGGGGAGGCGNYATKVVQPTVAGGGGGGGFAQNTFTTGQLTPGSVVTVVVGGGGAGGGQNGTSGSELGGNGASGRVEISWTAAAPVTTTIPGQTATCAATLTVNAPPTCPAGQTWNGTACVTVCNAPRSLVGGVCQCPAGQTWDGTSCVISCAAPRTLVGGVCQCPGGQLWNGTACVASISCPVGFVLQTVAGVSSCVFTTCPAGFTQGTDSSGNPICSAICTPMNVCGTGVNANNVVNSCSGAVVKICIVNREQCLNGACVPLQISLNLQVTPRLVPQGGTVSVNWTATNADECDIFQDSILFNNNSLVGTKQSGALTGRTVFTLSCTDFSGVTKIDQEVVNIIPVFEENCSANMHRVNGVCVPN